MPCEENMIILLTGHGPPAQVVQMKLCLNLPLELVEMIAKFGDQATLLDIGGMEPRTREHLEVVKLEIGALELLGLGLWIDGVPYNFDRSESIEAIAMNLPGLTGEFKNMRLPITAIPKPFVATGETMHDICEIILWSLRHLALGVNPSSRHDGEPFLQEDWHRKTVAGSPLRLRAALVEIRGDWLMMKETFHLPGWKEKIGCCWLCKATPDDFRNASSTASWRTERLSHWELLERMLRQGHTLNPLMSAPGIRSHCFKVDWLHSMDQGVGADFIGNLFWMLLPKMPGRNRKAKLKSFWMEVKEFYGEFRVEAKLPTLTQGMIKKQRASPKLRGKAAEIRALVPFARRAAEKHLSREDTVEHTVIQMAKHLDQLYATLSSSTIFRQDLMETHSKQFCILYSGLEMIHRRRKSKVWRIKPKFHLMQELCEMTEGANPAASWTYRDEDYGGSVAGMSRRKGGHRTAEGISRNFLLKWSAKFDVPMIVPR